MKKMIVCMLFVALFLTACGVSKPEEADIFAMDTLMNIKVWGNRDDLLLVTDEINRLENILSAADSGSVLSQINCAGEGLLSDDLLMLTKDSIALSEKTEGAFDPTVYPLVRLWGFPSNEYHVPSKEELDTALSAVGTEHIRLKNNFLSMDHGTMLDFGAIAKGYTAQQCADLLVSCEVDAALLCLGGNIQTLGTKPDGSEWTVGIADPETPTQAIGVLTFRGSKALVTSGGYQRYFEYNGQIYHHILDPKSGFPTENEIASVTVICENGEIADAYSTALFVMGFDKAYDFWRAQNDFDAVFVLKDRSIFATSGCADILSDCEFTVIK